MIGLGVHLVSILLLAVLVEVACRLGRFRPAICHALWLVVLVKLVVPPVVAWPLDSVGVNFFVLTPAVESVAPVVPNAGESIARLSFSDGDSAGSTTPGSTAALAPVNREVRWRGVSMVVLGLWLAGGLFVLGRMVWRARKARGMVASGESAPPWLQTRLKAICDTLQVSAPRLVIVNTGCGGVYVHFIGRPVLVISSNALEYIEADQWRTILTHEMAHLKRRDHWVAWLVLAASVAWWWNPCLWWVRHRIHLHSELACDAWVVNTFPEDRRNYAETMVRVLTMLSERFEPAPAMGLAVWSSATQERRLWMIMKGTAKSNVGWIYGAGLALLGVVLAPAWIAVGVEETVERPVAKTKSAPTPGWTLDLAPEKRVGHILNSSVNIEFENIHVKDILEFIQDTFQLNLVLDQRVVAPEHNASGNTSPSDAKDYATDGMVTLVRQIDVPLGKVLDILFTPLGLSYEIRGEYLWVSTKKQLAADRRIPLPNATFSEGKILTLLDSKLNIEFEDIHLQDIMNFIRASFELNVVVDSRVVMPEGGNPDSPPTGSPGYATDGMIDYINLKDASLGSALHAMTQLLDLTYAVDEDFVFISTPVLVTQSKSVALAE